MNFECKYDKKCNAINELTKTRKQIKVLEKKLSYILNTPINAHGETVELVLKRQEEE